MTSPHCTPCQDSAGTNSQSSGAGVRATELVLDYIDHRFYEQDDGSLPTAAELLQRIADLQAQLQSSDGRAAQLQTVNKQLSARIQELMLEIRRLEIGFRRHISESVSSHQLKLALGQDVNAEVPATEDNAACADGNVPCKPNETSAESNDSGVPPTPAKTKKRDPHGRRKVTFIPSIFIEVLPPEVIQKGLENFEKIGQEESSTIGRRRGGQIRLVERRGKFIARKKAASSSKPPQASAHNDNLVEHAQASSANAVAQASEDNDNLVEQTRVVSTSEPPRTSEDIDNRIEHTHAARTSAVAQTSEDNHELVVREHEWLSVPQDPGFKNNPFVDGAIVRYTPEASDKPSDCVVFIAPLAERPIARGLVDASLLAHLLVHKFDYHTPFYRQEVETSRQGYPLSRANMCRWQFEAGTNLMRLNDAMWQEALTQSWFGMDATGTAIQAKKENRYGHVFVLVSPGDSVLFKFAPKYDHATVAQLFGGYQGTIVADASANHNILFGPGKAREAGCWSHARKRFVKALRAGEGKDPAFALQIIKALFKIERRLALCSYQERLRVRQQESGPLVDSLFAWVHQRIDSVDTELWVHKGLVYLRNQETALREFLVNGEVPIHNNASERALRRVVKGRRNWLSHGSDDHAQRACAISSLIASCELVGLDPEFYLQEILTVLPSWSVNRILELSPNNWVETRKRLIAEGRLKYLDIAAISGSRLVFRTR